MKRGKGTWPGFFFCRSSGPSCWVWKYFCSRKQSHCYLKNHIATLRIQNNLQHHPLMSGYTYKQIRKEGQTCSFHTNKTHIQSENIVELKASEKSGDLYMDPLTHLYSYTFLASATFLQKCQKFCSLYVLQKAQMFDVF